MGEPVMSTEEGTDRTPQRWLLHANNDSWNPASKANAVLSGDRHNIKGTTTKRSGLKIKHSSLFGKGEAESQVQTDD